MIGVYDYTVIATYLSLLLGLAGIYSAAQNAPLAAMLYLMLAGLLDAFDGRIARTKANRTDAEKRFGIQIDSLNDLVCFGALIRLAYFNVAEEERQGKTAENRSCYLGVPVTASALAAPLFYLAAQYFRLNCAAVYAPGLFLLGVLYITPLRVKKPHLGGILLLAALGLAEFVSLVCVLTR